MGAYYVFLTKDWSSCFWEVPVFTKGVGNRTKVKRRDTHNTHKGTLQVPTYDTRLYLPRNLRLAESPSLQLINNHISIF